MKKVFALFLFIGCSLFAHAQDKKPTKEETVAFINRTINEVKGFNLPFSMGKLSSATFSETKLVYNCSSFYEEKKTFDSDDTYEEIRWDKLDITRIEYSKSENTASYYSLIFNSNFKCTTTFKNFLSGKNDKTTEKTQSSMHIFIPDNKAESIKKAFLRLAEIAKEENKDPFAN